MSCDTQAQNKAFREKFDFPYDLLCDEGREMSQAYGAVTSAGQRNASRVSYLIDPQGRIAKVYAKVSPGGHPDQVLADLP